MVMPLRILLPGLAVCLVASGAAAIGVAGASAAGGYLMAQADDALRACAAGMLSHRAGRGGRRSLARGHQGRPLPAAAHGVRVRAR